MEWAGRAGVHGCEPRAEGRLHLQAGHVGTAEKPLGRRPSPGTQQRTGKARCVVAKLDTQPPATPSRRPEGGTGTRFARGVWPRSLGNT